MCLHVPPNIGHKTTGSSVGARLGKSGAKALAIEHLVLTLIFEVLLPLLGLQECIRNSQ